MRIPFISAFLCMMSMAAGHGQSQGQQPEAPEPQRGTITGVVTDVENAVIPAATVSMPEAGGKTQTALSDETGSFTFNDVAPAVPHQITVHANGFADYVSPPIVISPGQALHLTDIHLTISVVETTVAAMTVEQLGSQQVKAEEKQRLLGIIPNFFVVYDKNPVPLTAKLKYELAFRAATDVVAFAADFFLSGINQAADAPSYQQGLKGYGQRVGSAYATSFTDVMVGGAVLPSLLHQDPRYFYQGTGTGKSRALHAISSPFVCRGDNGLHQVNYSSMGGDLIAASLQNAYYPVRDRGPGLVLSGAAIDTGGRIVNALVQEFILQKYTSGAKKKP